MNITIHNYQSLYKDLIDKRASFEIYQVPVSDMFHVCGVLEEYIEAKNLKCRIYTENRYVGILSSILNKQYGILTAVFMLAHNLLTWDPDYIISRDIVNNRVKISYQK